MVMLTNIFDGKAKPRIVYLDKELKNAMYIDFIKVIDYTDSTIVFQEIENFAGYYSYEWFNTENFVLKAKSDTAYLTSKIQKGQLGFDKFTTGYMPQKGEEVLIVINKENQVSLFANLKNSVFRFWSPFFTRSTALFYFKEPALKLENKDGITDRLGEYETCWGGCLLSKSELLTYAHKENSKVYRGKTVMDSGKALFIWEISGSEAFYLKDIDVWEKEYLNKTLTIKGILIQFVEGKSMILDWEIIKIEE